MFVKGSGISGKDICNVLLIQLGDIGDVVLSFPAVRALRENFPQADIVVAVREKARELMEDCRWVSSVISINEKKRTWQEELRYQKRFFLSLRRFRFDLAVDLRTGDRGAFIALLSGARQRVGFFAKDGKLWRNRVFTHLVVPESAPGQHIAQYYQGLLGAYDIKTEHTFPEHDVPDGRYQAAKALLEMENIPPDRPIIAVQPFSLWKYKEWGVDKYIRLINWLVSEYGVSVIVTGSLDERERADEIIKHCPRYTYNLAGKTSIGMLSAVFKACRLFVGVDSAGVHIAAAVGLPTVSIFGPSSYITWAPRGAQHFVVHKDLPCVPCRDKGCKDSEISRCLDELTFEEVQAVVRDRMSKLMPPAGSQESVI